MKTTDVIDYVLSKRSISYYELNRLLYAFQYDRAIENRPPLMDDAQFFAVGKNIVVESHAEQAYCAYGARDIIITNDKKETTISSEDKAVLDELMNRYETVPMFDPEFFGDNSLVAVIYNNMPETKPNCSMLRPRPPISYTAMKQFIHGYEKRGKIDVKINIDPYILRIFRPLIGQPICHEQYGITPWRRILEWTNEPTPVYTVRLSIMAEYKDGPLGFVADLLCTNCVVQSQTFHEIPNKIPMEHDGYEFKIKIK